MKISRRRLIQTAGSAALGGGVSALAATRPARAYSSGGSWGDGTSWSWSGSDGWHSGGGSGGSPAVTPFQVPLPISPVLEPVASDAVSDYYEITMQETQVEILPGLTTTIWGYNGITPGPTIRTRTGRQTVVRQNNALTDPMSAHLHGGHTPPESDGHPNDLIQPGFYKDYFYPNNQQAATLWYHDHAVDVTGPHVYFGLAGIYIVGDDLEDSLSLPSGAYDVPLVIQDRIFNADGSLDYTLDSRTLEEGIKGDVMLVNGAPQPYFEVGTRKYRFRILNGSNSRIYDLTLDSGDSIVQIGTDGGLLPQPVPRSRITIAPAERIEIVIDFAEYPVGSQIVLQNTRDRDTTPLMRFDVVRQESDDSSLPSILRPIEPIPANTASITRSIRLSRDWNGGDRQWVIDGKPYDVNRIDQRPKLDAVEIWHFENRSGHPHPMHIHDIMFQILDVEGRSPSPGEAGWKDTVMVPPWGDARVITKFTDLTGVYVFHCHNLEHEDHMMMAQFEVVP